MMPSVNSLRNMADELNERKLCLMYSHPHIVRISNTPKWILSPERPGERNKIQKAKADTDSFIIDNPEFLEVN